MRRLFLVVALLGLLVAGQPGSHAQVKPGDLKDYNDAMKALQSSSAADRAAGLSFLALLGGEAKGASKEVIGALTDGSADVRKWAATAIGKVNPDIAEPVITLVQGQDYDARIAALERLGKLGTNAGPATAAVLTFMQQAQGGDRVSAVRTLAAIGANDPKLGGALAKIALDDPDPKVRTAAAQAIAKQKDPQGALEFLAGAFNKTNDPKQRLAVVTALGDSAKGNPQAIKLLEDLGRADKTPAVQAAIKAAIDKAKKK
jgi:HEAT repeat protein